MGSASACRSVGRRQARRAQPRWWWSDLDPHPLVGRCLGPVVGVDPRGTPEWLGAVLSPDQADHLAVDGPPTAATRAALSFPEQAKAGAMPADDRVGTYDLQAGLPGPPPSREPDPKGAIWTRQARWPGGAVEHQEFVTEGQVLEDQVATTPQRRHGQTKEQHEPGKQAAEDARRFARIPLL